jgi:hypothetical protein
MSKFRHLTVEELLFRAERVAMHSPLIEELVRRLRFPVDSEEPDYNPKDNTEKVECPVCEATLYINTFAEDTLAPTLTKEE